MTPAGDFGERQIEHYARLGVDRLIVLPQPGATGPRRHAPVPAGDILRNIAMVSEMAANVAA